MYYLRLIRYSNLVIIGLTLILAVFHQLADVQLFNLFLLIFFSICVAAAGYVVNDIFDKEIDLINKPERVIIGKNITEKSAWQFYFSLNFLALLISIYWDFTAQKMVLIPIFFITVTSLFLYAKWLKKIAIVGNFLVSALCALTPAMIYIGWNQLFATNNQNFPKNLDFFITFSFLISFFREIVKDIEDIDGDKAQNAHTLPIVTNIAFSKVFASLFLIVLLLQVFVMSIGIRKSELSVIDSLSSYYVFFLIEIPIIALLYLLFKAKYKTHFSNLSFYTKILMLVGLLFLLLS